VPDATYTKKINKAFVIEPKYLQYFYGEGKKYMETNACVSFKTEVIGIVKNIDQILIRKDPDSIIDYSNPRKNELTSIAIFMKSENEEHSFYVSFENNPFLSPVSLKVGGKNLEEIDPCSRKIEAELLECSQWYSFISNRVWLIKYRWILFFICIFLFLWGLISTFSRQHQLRQARNKVESVLSEYENEISDANEMGIKTKAEEILKVIDKRSSPINIVQVVLFGIGAFFAGKYIERFMHFLFPRVVFEIGAGKKRHENIKRIRKHVGYWIMTLIVGLVLLIIGRKMKMN
jgi:hypothetical protein